MIKLVIFDLDQTLRDAHGNLFPQTIPILQFFKNRHIRMAVASFNSDAKNICAELGIDYYFDDIIGYQAHSKICHVKRIKHNYSRRFNREIKPSEILFFDDYQPNIDIIRNWYHINSIKVNPNLGIVFKTIEPFFVTAFP